MKKTGQKFKTVYPNGMTKEEYETALANSPQVVREVAIMLLRLFPELSQPQEEPVKKAA